MRRLPLALVAMAMLLTPALAAGQALNIPGVVEEEDCAAHAAMVAEEDPAKQAAMGKSIANSQASRAASASRQSVESGGDGGGAGY